MFSAVTLAAALARVYSGVLFLLQFVFILLHVALRAADESSLNSVLLYVDHPRCCHNSLDHLT